MKIINLDILSNPLNWITVLIWLFVVAFAVHATGLTEPTERRGRHPTINS